LQHLNLPEERLNESHVKAQYQVISDAEKG